MAAPNTGGSLKTSIQDMQVGDYIKVEFHFNSPYSFIRDYQGSVNEIPVTGNDDLMTGSSSRYDFAYMIKADKGLLISDRVIANNVSWDTLNNEGAIQGNKLFTLGGVTGIIRSLGGGNSYATADGKSSATDTGNGAWPVDNEWDTYLVNKDYGTGAGRDDVWHWSHLRTWIQETRNPSLGASTGRIGRGLSTVKDLNATILSSASGTSIGFRPVFEYQEVTP